MIRDIAFQEQIDTANLFLKENELEKSIESYTEALLLASTTEQKIDLYNVLGRLYQKTKQGKKAIIAFNESIKLYDLLDGDKLIDKAAIHNNLGVLYAEIDQKQSITNYTEAYKIYNSIIESGIEDYNLHLANTNFALAEVYLKANDFYFAKKHFKESIRLYQLNETFDLDEFVASVYYQLGNIYTEEFNLYDARVSYLKSLALFEGLYKKDNLKFQPYLAAVYNNLGVTFKSMDDFQKALEYYQKALNNYGYLAENVNALFLPYLAATYNSIAILYSENKNFELAIEYANKAYSIYYNLANQSPDEHTHYLATSLHNLGLFNFELRNLESAEYYFQKSLKMRKVLAINAPESFDADVCTTALNLLELYQARLEASLNLKFKTKCIKLLADVEVRLNKFNDDRPVIKSMKSDCQYYKEYFSSITLNELELNTVFKKVDELTQDINSTILPNEKIVFQNRIVKLLEKTFKRYSENEKLINELAYAYNDLAWLNIRIGKFENAETIILKAFNLEQPIIALKCNLAHSVLLQDKFEKAKALYLEFKNEKNSNNEPYSFTVLRDFKKLEEDGFNHEHFERIKAIL